VTKVSLDNLESGIVLLYSDKDFDPFVQHLGVGSALGKV
jgi:hypothetical protein